MTELRRALEELLKERSLWEVFRQSPCIFKNAFNRWVLLAAALGFSVFSWFVLYAGMVRPVGLPVVNVFALFGRWSEVGISFSGTILGFLIAGFSILFTLVRPETAIPLLIAKSSQEGLSQLKFIFFVFIDVFVHYAVFLSWCFAMFLLGGDGGMLDTIYRGLHGVLPTFVRFCALCIFVVWACWFILLLLKLKSFIWNLYQVFLLSLADRIDNLEQENGSSGSS